MKSNMQRGFTAIELLIVISLFVLLAGMASARANNSIQRAELEQSARTLASDIRLLQQMALNAGPQSNRKQYSIIFSNTAPYGYYLKEGATAKKSVLFASHVLLNNPPNNITFNENGVPGSGYTIALSSTKVSGMKTVYVEGVTGRVRVE